MGLRIACQIRIIYGVAPLKIFIVDGALIRPGTVYIVPGVVDTHLIPLMVITCHRNTVNTHAVAIISNACAYPAQTVLSMQNTLYTDCVYAVSSLNELP